MSFSSGTYSLYATGNPVVTNTTISSTWANNTLNDIATALSTCMLKDGTQTATASVGFAQGIDVTTAATTTSTTFACFNTNATTVNAFGAASVALNIGHASAAAAFAGGISIPTGKSVTGAGTATVVGFKSGSFGTAGNQGALYLLGSTSGTATFSTDATVTKVTLDKPLDLGSNSLTAGAISGTTLTGTGLVSTSASSAIRAYGVGVGGGANTEFLEIYHSANVAWLNSSKSGTGTTRQINLAIDSTTIGLTVATTGRLYAPSLATTASAANAFFDGADSNQFLRSTSSLALKGDLVDLSLHEARLISFGRHAFSYASLSDADDPNKRWIGYGAEEIDAVDKRLVTYDEHGKPNWVQYERFVVPHGIILEDHESRLKALEAKLAQ